MTTKFVRPIRSAENNVKVKKLNYPLFQIERPLYVIFRVAFFAVWSNRIVRHLYTIHYYVVQWYYLAMNRQNHGMNGKNNMRITGALK